MRTTTVLLGSGLIGVDNAGRFCRLGLMKGTIVILAVAVSVAGIPLPAPAQMPVPPPGAYGQLLSAPQLDQMLGPIALYPDPLIAQILPAATQPSQVALAYSFVNSGGNPDLIDQQPWDDSVKGVAHCPQVLNMMANNMAWTSEIGQAFINQPTDVMDSIQRLRAEAQQLGNLQTTTQDQVINDDGEIDIVPTDPDTLYVPTYDPGVIFYQSCYGQPFITFGIGFHVGFWLNHDFDWHGHNIIAWDRGHPRPSGWWHQRPSARPVAVFARAPVWHPAARPVFAPARGIDRGFEPRGNSSVRARVEPRAEPRAEPRPEVREAPARPVPRVSAFGGGESASQARAASSRGEESRQSMGSFGGGGRGGKR